MGLDVLESLFYGLSSWCFEFLHFEVPKNCELGLKGSSFSGFVIWKGDFVNCFGKL